MLVSEFFAGVPWLERVYQAAEPVGRRREMGARGRRALLHAGRVRRASATAARRVVRARVPSSGRQSQAAVTAAKDAAAAVTRSSADRDHALDRDPRALAAMASAGTLTSPVRSRRQSRSLGSVIIFM